MIGFVISGCGGLTSRARIATATHAPSKRQSLDDLGSARVPWLFDRERGMVLQTGEPIREPNVIRTLVPVSESEDPRLVAFRWSAGTYRRAHMLGGSTLVEPAQIFVAFLDPQGGGDPGWSSDPLCISARVALVHQRGAKKTERELDATRGLVTWQRDPEAETGPEGQLVIAFDRARQVRVELFFARAISTARAERIAEKLLRRARPEEKALVEFFEKVRTRNAAAPP